MFGCLFELIGTLTELIMKIIVAFGIEYRIFFVVQ
jgi:hypothetical protein